MRHRIAWPGLAIAIAIPSHAHATWSIVAVDPRTQEVGVAVASCVEAPFGTTLLPTVAGVVPGTGALAAQALLDQDLRDYAVEQLAAGLAPADVIAAVNAIDGSPELRQYGVVTLDGQTATHTGASNQDWAGALADANVTAQGNILYGPEVVDDAIAAFVADAPACPFTLADRLLLALEAGSAQGGDSRCSMEQSALAAVLIVARPGDPIDAPTIDLRIASQEPGGANPVMLLRAEYDQWRLRNPPDDAGCDGGTSTDDGSSTAAADESSTDDDGTTETSGSSSDGVVGEDSTTTAAAGGESSSGSAPAQDQATGCGCAHRRTAMPWLVLLIGARRRQRLLTTE